jgi:FkbM family methyltransferase
MLHAARTGLKEWVRCTRHNVLHLRRFKVRYRGGEWFATDGDVSLRFNYYPYLAFHDVEGYFGDGRFVPGPGMTVLDVGGCAGEYALYAAMKVGPAGRVLMLEPDPKNVELARENFARNGNPSNLEIVPAGMWSTTGTLRFAAGRRDESTVVRDGDAAAGPTIEIKTYSLAGLAAERKLSRIDLVKMDIEGAEIEAIKGVAELPGGVRPKFAIASYHVVDGARTAETMERMFRDYGYETATGNARHLTTWAWPKQG